jgi:hypothetical protein
MPARTKGRAKFDFRGRPFVWWIEDETWLRIASLDKKFVVAWLMWSYDGETELLHVIGEEFPGQPPHRPIELKLPRDVITASSMGARVDAILAWTFGPPVPSPRGRGLG